VVEFALLGKNHGKRSKKYGTLCGRPIRTLAENGRVRYGKMNKFGPPSGEKITPIRNLEKLHHFIFNLEEKF